MDSLTQIVLGAAVGEAVLGKKVGTKAMLWGAVAGTIPDFDVLLRFVTDDITSTEMHRGFSHSIVFAVLIAPILGWIAHKIHQKKYADASFKNWSWLFFWATVTHPLLDAHTTWGTQFFWPFEYRLAYQNIFVVDPLYTIPFLICLIVAMFYKRTNPKRRKFNNAGLIISTTYMVITLILKGISHKAFENSLDNNHIDYVELDSKPSPMNTIMWNALVETNNGYRTANYSLLDSKAITFSKEFPKNHGLLEPYKDQKVIQQLIRITAGWFIIEKQSDKMIMWDLRFGQTGMDLDTAPFLMSYDLTVNKDGQIEAKKNDPKIENIGEAIDQLIERIKGN
jgi:inner membrane protein